MPTFQLAKIVPLVEAHIDAVCRQRGHAQREAIIASILSEPEGQEAVKRAKSLSPKQWDDAKVAGNMIDWFSANFSAGGVLTALARQRFDRSLKMRQWIYFPRGSSPKIAVKPRGVAAPDGKFAKPFAIPRVFVSYSHDSPAHKCWVERLANNLVTNGVDVVLDQWELVPSADLPQFMERGVRDADWVVVVCTDTYVKKANDGVGGGGYEKMIMSAELVQNQAKRKFIPVVRTKNFPPVPTFLEGKLYIDFTDDVAFPQSLEQLLRTVLAAPTGKKPPIGANPFAKGAKPKIV